MLANTFVTFAQYNSRGAIKLLSFILSPFGRISCWVQEAI